MNRRPRAYAIRHAVSMPLFIAAAGALAAGTGPAVTQPSEADGTRAEAASTKASGAPRVVELFTSHGCSSCPPADLLLGELLDTGAADIVLEYHVDYWDSLVHGGDGAWKDPFSHADWSARQRDYASAGLGGRRGVYTPQAIVDGTTALVGSDRRGLANALGELPDRDLVLEIDADAGRATLLGDADALRRAEGADIVLVRYLEAATTRITAGENRHLTLDNRHVVLAREVLAKVGAGSGTIIEIGEQIAALADGEGCALLVEPQDPGPFLAAAACP